MSVSARNRYAFILVCAFLCALSFVHAAPSSPTASIIPGAPADDDDLLGYCDATFDDSTACYYEYNWSIDGTPYATGVLLNGTISIGEFHSCALLVNGTLLCWGSSVYTQLGYGGSSQQNNPVYVNSSELYSSVSSNQRHSCGLLVNGSVMCWGFGESGRLGYGSTAQQSSPVMVNSTEEFAVINAAYRHSCGILANGSALCWGNGLNGRLGNGGTGNQHNPYPVSSSQTFTDIGGGYRHSCGVAANGSVLCWGYALFGQIGDGGRSDRLNPVLINTTAVFSKVSLGYYHSCGLLTNGSIMCWGSSVFGQIGYGGVTQQDSPVLVNTSELFSSVSAGYNHTCGLLVNGSAMCWGAGNSGRLGNGGTSNQLSPVLVNSTEIFSSISAGGAHTCGVLLNGSVLCWGLGTSGQLGNGGTTQQNSPYPINSTGLYALSTCENALASTVPASETTLGENWTLACRANSDSGSSSWAQSAATLIRDPFPYVSSVSLVASDYPENTTLASLTATPVGTLDTTSLIYNWRVNEADYAYIYMPFDTTVNGNGGIVKDYSTQVNNNGTLGDSALTCQAPTWTTGKIGGAYRFNGDTDNACIAINDFAPPSSLSIVVWYYPVGPANAGDSYDQIIANKHNSEYGVRLSGTGCNLFGRAGTTSVYDYTNYCNTTNRNNWYHVAFVFDSVADMNYLYVDGILVNSTTNTATLSDQGTQKLYIGRHSQFNFGTLNGSLDDFRFYNRSLSGQQVYQLFLEGNNGLTTSSIVSNETSVGENWSVVVTPNNSSIGDGLSVTSNTVPIVAPTFTGYLHCSFFAGTTCPTNYTKFIGVENSTGGYSNAHVQNATVNTYANSLCCSSTVATLANTCGNTVLQLSAETNAHVQQANETTYAVNACLNGGADAAVQCVYADTTCTAGYACVASIAGAGGLGNSTNAHVGRCGLYERQVCCKVRAYTEYDTCTPDPEANLVINGDVTCGAGTIVAQNLTVNGNFTLLGTSLTTQRILVNQSGRISIHNSTQTVWINDDLQVTGTYVLDNATMHMNVTTDDEYGIFVTSAGTFIAENNSLITPGDVGGITYLFNTNGTFQLKDTIVNNSNEIQDRGTQSILDNVSITTISAGYYNYAGGTVTIINSTIITSSCSSLDLRGQNNVVVDNYMSCGGSSAYIDGADDMEFRRNTVIGRLWITGTTTGLWYTNNVVNYSGGYSAYITPTGSSYLRLENSTFATAQSTWPAIMVRHNSGNQRAFRNLTVYGRVGGIGDTVGAAQNTLIENTDVFLASSATTPYGIGFNLGSGSNLTVRNVVVTVASSSSSDSRGVYLVGVSNAVIENVSVTSGETLAKGLYISGGTHIDVSNVSGSFTGASSAGVWLTGSKDVTLNRIATTHSGATSLGINSTASNWSVTNSTFTITAASGSGFYVISAENISMRNVSVVSAANNSYLGQFSSITTLVFDNVSADISGNGTYGFLFNRSNALLINRLNLTIAPQVNRIVRIEYSNGVTIGNSTFNYTNTSGSNQRAHVFLYYTNNTVVRNTSLDGRAYAFNLDRARNTTFVDVTAVSTSNVVTGWDMWNINITNSSFTGTGGNIAVILLVPENITIVDSTITGTGGGALTLSNGNPRNVTVYRSTLQGSNALGAHNIVSTLDFTAYDSTIIGGIEATTMYVTPGAQINYRLVNTSHGSFITTYCNGTQDCNITVQWYARINLTDQGAAAVANATVNFSTVGSALVSLNTSDNAGLSPWVVVTEIENINGVNTTFQNTTIRVNKTYYQTNQVSVNITSTQTIPVTINGGDLPYIWWVVTDPVVPFYDGQTATSVTITANVTDGSGDLASVNFTVVAPNGSVIVNNANGTQSGDLWTTTFTLDAYGVWNYTVNASDAIGQQAQTAANITFLEIEETLSTSVGANNTVVNVTGRILDENGNALANTGYSVYVGSEAVFAGFPGFSAWAYRIPLTVNASLVTEDLKGFPLVVRINSTEFSNAQSDGDDFLFTNSSASQLPHEIEYYNHTSGELIAWVRADLSSSQNTTIYLYFGNAGATNQENVSGVWNSTYQLVVHASELSGTTISDSSQYGNNGTKLSSTEPAPVVSCAVGPCQDYDGSNDYVQITDSASLTYFTSTTVGAWVFVDAFGIAGQAYIRQIFSDESGSGTFVFRLGSRGLASLAQRIGYAAWSGSPRDSESATNLTASQWTYLVVSRNGTHIQYYLDGALDYSEAYSWSATNTANNWRIGTMTSGGRAFDGKIDALFLYNETLSAAEIAARYENQRPDSAAFMAVGSLETSLMTNASGHYNFTVTMNQTANITVNLTVDSIYGQAQREFTVTNIPNTPTLLLLANNTTTLERYPTFNWSDESANYYELDITAPAGCAALPIVNTSNVYYTSVTRLCVDEWYNWSVRACNTGAGCSSWASNFTFKINSTVGLAFTTSEVNFTSLGASLPSFNSTNDTLDNNPAPLVYNNTGNVDLATSVLANAPLWTSQALNTSYFEYGDENASSWLNVTANYTALATNVTLAQLRQLEIRIWAPVGEPAGVKTVSLTVLGASIE